MTEAQAEAQWELGELVHDLDMQSNARMREWVAGLGLTVAQASALREMIGPMTMRELAGRMSCEPSNATIVIDKLETLRLIERSPHPTDRRAERLVVTPEGAELRERLLKVLTEEPLFAGLTQDEQDALQGLFDSSGPFSALKSSRPDGVGQRNARRRVCEGLARIPVSAGGSQTAWAWDGAALPPSADDSARAREGPAETPGSGGGEVGRGQLRSAKR